MRWAAGTAAVLFGLCGGPARPGDGGNGRTLPFEECLLLIRDVGQSLGVEAASVVDTHDLQLVRFSVSDGSLLVTCSRPDNRIVMVRSPIR